MTHSSADLAACLAFTLDEEARAKLLARLNGGAWEELFAAAKARWLLPALVMAVAEKGLTAGLPSVRLPDGRSTPPARLADEGALHAERQSVLLARLEEIIAILATDGIRPVLLKGARALWSGVPAWRSLRDLDLLILEPEAERADALLRGAGYRYDEVGDVPEDWHHRPSLYREDLPGWVEIHSRAAMHRADLLLPTELLRDAAVEVAGREGRKALVLPAPLQILHGMIHHHIGHRGDKGGTLDFRGLYEIAADVDGLDAAGYEALLRHASRHPRLLAMLDLWLAAAAAVFALEVRAPLAVYPDAARRWARMSARAERGGKRGNYDGLLEEFGLAVAGARLRRLPQGGSVVGRLRARALVIQSLLAPATD